MEYYIVGPVAVHLQVLRRKIVNFCWFDGVENYNESCSENSNNNDELIIISKSLLSAL